VKGDATPALVKTSAADNENYDGLRAGAAKPDNVRQFIEAKLVRLPVFENRQHESVVISAVITATPGPPLRYCGPFTAFRARTAGAGPGNGTDSGYSFNE